MTQPVKKTALYEVHKRLGAKIVEFAGYLMPVQYSGIIAEHKTVRSAVGVFDVSHMGEFVIRGEKALDFLQKTTINDVSKLTPWRAQYSAMCYEDGGIVDDLLVYKYADDHYILVVNASNIQKDFDWLSQHTTDGMSLTDISDQITLLAVQGPKAETTLQKLTNLDLSRVKYYHFAEEELANISMAISRTGYTGEDGFELYVDTKYSKELWESVMDAGKEFDIQPIGLGARDTLRLEMGFALYGNDIDQTTNPIEAKLGWITKADAKDFIGKETILKVKNEGVKRRLVGFEAEGRNVPRHGHKLMAGDNEIGEVTSGTFSPSLEKGIGMGYVAPDYSREGSEIMLSIRGRVSQAKVIKLPFYKK